MKMFTDEKGIRHNTFNGSLSTICAKLPDCIALIKERMIVKGKKTNREYTRKTTFLTAMYEYDANGWTWFSGSDDASYAIENSKAYSEWNGEQDVKELADDFGINVKDYIDNEGTMMAVCYRDVTLCELVYIHDTTVPEFDISYLGKE